jgi:hypothetical protein
VLPELVLYPLDGLGNASASKLPMAITPCRLSLWLEPTPAAWADANNDVSAHDATDGVLNDDMTAKSKTKGIESKTSVLAAHAAAIPGRSIDWVVWSSTAPLPASYFWESTQIASSLGSSLDTARSAEDRAKDSAQIESKSQELTLALTQRSLNASDLFWSHEEAYDLLPMKEPSKKTPATYNDTNESSAESSEESLKRCPVEASPAFKSVAHFGSALSAALNDRFGGSFPFSGPLVLSEPTLTASPPQSDLTDDQAVDDSAINFHIGDDTNAELPYLLLVGCGYSGTRAMAAYLSQHLELPVCNLVIRSPPLHSLLFLKLFILKLSPSRQPFRRYGMNSVIFLMQCQTHRAFSALTLIRFYMVLQPLTITTSQGNASHLFHY